MDEKPYLRRQALLCLKLSQSYSDAETAQNLDLMAAEFHAQALREEFHASTDSGLSDDTFNKKDIEHLLLLLGSTDIVDFDEPARQLIGEFISRAVSSGKLGITALGKFPTAMKPNPGAPLSHGRARHRALWIAGPAAGV